MDMPPYDLEEMPYLHNIEDDCIYEDIVKALNSNDLVLFAGSGLSSQASTDDGRHPPSWKVLLEGMVNWCDKKRLIGTKYSREIRNLIENGFLIEAGQELQEVLELASLQQCIKEVTLCDEAIVGDAHTLIAQIPFRAFLTTNYDAFIEDEFKLQRGMKLPAFYERTLEEVLNAYREKKPFIFKLHGDANDPDSIILGNRSYERLFYYSPIYKGCLDSIFNLSSILFIGFGASDPDLEDIINRSAIFDGRSKRHWLLVQKGKYPILKARRFWKYKGINVIQYEPDSSHSGVVQFLSELASRMTKPKLAKRSTLIKSLEIKSKIETTF